VVDVVPLAVPAAVDTYFATDWICVGESVCANDGMIAPAIAGHGGLTAPPSVTCWTTHAMLGFT